MADEDLLAKLLEELLSASEKKDDGHEKETKEASDDNPFGGIDIEAILKLSELFSEMNKDDKSSQLLSALKPHLRKENQTKVDSAMKLMKLMSLLPYLQESGLLSDLF